MANAIGWRVEMWRPGMMKKGHVDFEPEHFASAMEYGEIAQRKYGFVHIAVSPIHAPDRLRDPINTDCAPDCPVCG